MPPPKARICYICGRPTLLPGFDNHVVQCRELFEKREMQKPPKERRPCPIDPMLMNPYHTGSSSKKGYSSTDLDAINDASQKAWQQTLLACRNCGRKFLPDKLTIHNRSCTASNPARRIDEKIGGRDVKSGVASEYEYSHDEPPSIMGGDRRPSSAGISRKIHGSSSGAYGASSSEFSPFDTPTYGHLIKCKDCGRNFNEVSYEKHVRICKKVFVQKRKVYDSAKHRAKGTELQQYLASNRRSGGSSGERNGAANSGIASSKFRTLGQPRGETGFSSNSATQKGGLPKWKAESLSFRNAVRQARLIANAEQKSKSTGIPLHALLPTNSRYDIPDAIEATYIPCPHCGRSFNEKAAERHIPKCQSIINKPARLVKGSGIAAKNPGFSPPSKSEDRDNMYGENYGYGATPVSSINGTRASRHSLDNDPFNRHAISSSTNKSGANDVVRFNPSGISKATNMGRTSAGAVRSSAPLSSSYTMNAQPSYGTESGRYGVNEPVRLSAGPSRTASYAVSEPARMSRDGNTRNSYAGAPTIRTNQLSSGSYGAFSNSNSRVGSGRR